MPRHFGLRCHQPVYEAPLWLQTLLYVTGLLAALFAVAVLFVWAFGMTGKAFAQQHHHVHHAHYQNWVNKADKGCCNNQDCGELADTDERTSRGFQEVRVEGEWCPVEPQHYLKTGNVPNAAVAHVCVLKPSPVEPKPVCDRLLCYQPKPGI